MSPFERPSLDAHAHIAGDVSQEQVDDLGEAVVLSMTRSPGEGQYALRAGGATSPTLVWGLGVHPGVEASVTSFSPAAFTSALASFAVVGEVGLDRRGDLTGQIQAFGEHPRSLCGSTGPPECSQLRTHPGRARRDRIPTTSRPRAALVQRFSRRGAKGCRARLLLLRERRDDR